MVKTTQTLFCFSMLVAMASCSTTSKSAIDASSKERKSVDGFATESVREAYLRLKKHYKYMIQVDEKNKFTIQLTKINDEIYYFINNN